MPKIVTVACCDFMLHDRLDGICLANFPGLEELDPLIQLAQLGLAPAAALDPVAGLGVALAADRAGAGRTNSRFATVKNSFCLIVKISISVLLASPMQSPPHIPDVCA